MANFDLHFHSRASDGEADLETLLAAVRARPDLEAVALADHDTVNSSVAFAAAEPRAIVAAELTVSHRRAAPHLLGYGFNPSDPGLRAYLTERTTERTTRASAWGVRFAELGLRFEPEVVLAASDSLAKSHIVAELRRHPENAAILPPAPATERESDAIYTVYLKTGGVADISKLVPSTLIGVAEGIALIHRAGGIAVLAHPQASFYELGQKRSEADWHAGVKTADADLRVFAEAGLDGLEVFSHNQGLEIRSHLLELCSELGLAVSAGTDDHTPTGEHIGDAFDCLDDPDGLRAPSPEQIEGWLADTQDRIARLGRG